MDFYTFTWACSKPWRDKTRGIRANPAMVVYHRIIALVYFSIIIYNLCEEKSHLQQPTRFQYNFCSNNSF